MYQLARFINPAESVYNKLVWVKDKPHEDYVKYAYNIREELVEINKRDLIFSSNVIGINGYAMIAFTKQIELLPVFSDWVKIIAYSKWVLLADDAVRELGTSRPADVS